MSSRREARFNRIWYHGELPSAGLRLLELAFRVVVGLRRLLYRGGILRRARFDVPVIVIGNLTVGGTGKTPLALALVQALKTRGHAPGIVSRGHGGRGAAQALHVSGDTDPRLAGDEPVLLARRSGVPVVVHRQRARAVRELLAANRVDVVICDDGLQHQALARDVEIAVVDASRGFGNGRLLPAGPLREPLARLRNVDHVVINGDSDVDLPPVRQRHRMRLQPSALVNVANGGRRAADALAGERCAAIAGIGNPQRFFSTLAELGYTANCRAFPDHHDFQAAELDFAGDLPLLMTEKDAVKCRRFARGNWWYLEISAVLDEALINELAERVRRRRETER